MSISDEAFHLFFTSVMHFQWGKSEHHSIEARAPWTGCVAFNSSNDASRRPLYVGPTTTSAENVTTHYFNRKPKIEFQSILNGNGDAMAPVYTSTFQRTWCDIMTLNSVFRQNSARSCVICKALIRHAPSHLTSGYGSETTKKFQSATLNLSVQYEYCNDLLQINLRWHDNS